jgi:23S rRNA G2069 N7-methylase RlmK/C1962 C5-methylase RlmI
MEKGKVDTKIDAQAEMLANRLKKRLRHLTKWAKRTSTNAFRLYDRDIPEIPLVLDLYDDVVSGALYKRPYEKDQDDEARWLMAMGDSVAQALELKRDNIIIKLREKKREIFNAGNAQPCDHIQAQYEKIAERGLVRLINEGGLRFKVNLSDYLDTGLFLDRRAMRHRVRIESNEKRILNLFCYTASFSVYAAKGGALSTDSVDLSNTYLNWAKHNFALNGLDAEIVRHYELILRNGTTINHHRLIRADVIEFLHKAAAARCNWDIIIIDPPAFSNSTGAADFDLQRDHIQTLECCLSVLAPGGKVWFSAGTRSFKTSTAEIESALAKHFPSIAVTDIAYKTIDEDFRGKKTPKTYVLTIG